MTRPVRTAAEAIVALSARDGLGETLEWGEVFNVLADLERNPLGPRDLRYVLSRLNNREEIAGTLEDWCCRAAAERQAAGLDAARTADEVLTPLQRTSLGIAATSGVAFALGTVAAPVAVPVAALAGFVAVTTGYGRWRLTRRRDRALREVSAFTRLAEIARG